MLGSNAFGMELHAMHILRLVLRPMISPSVSALISKQSGKLCRSTIKRMIARRLEIVGHIA